MTANCFAAEIKALFSEFQMPAAWMFLQVDDKKEKTGLGWTVFLRFL